MRRCRPAFTICSIPASEIPLNFILRGAAHYSIYDANDGTAPNFQTPDDHGTFSVRTGLRWGGVEPTLFPPLAMELSVWYEGQYRTDSGAYGFNGDRVLNQQSHLFWAEAALAYTLPKSQQNFYVRLTAGTSRGCRPLQRLPAGRISAFGVGISALAAGLLFSGNQRPELCAAQRKLPVAAGPEETLGPGPECVQRLAWIICPARASPATG